MTFRILGGSLLAMWTLAAVAAVGAQEAAKAPQSVLDGVYTEEQATRGAAVYALTCASCHGDTLAGGDMAPGLAGKDFLSGWVKMSVNDLFDKVRVDMPQDNPSTLTPEQSADVTAFLLSSQKYPAGTTELPKESEALKAIKIEAPKEEAAK